MANKLEIIFVILAIVQGFHCYSLGNITDDSKLIFREYYNGSALPFEFALRQVTVNTTEDIDAIRAVDVSGQNGTATMNLYNSRSVQMVFSSSAINRGFNFSLELYKNPERSGYTFGNITTGSKLIFQEYYDGSALPFEITLRQVTVNTTEDIDAIHAFDVSGQNGTATMNLYNSRSVQMVFSSNVINRGFNFSLELYKNPAKNSDVASKSVSMIWIITLVVTGLCATRNL